MDDSYTDLILKVILTIIAIVLAVLAAILISIVSCAFSKHYELNKQEWFCSHKQWEEHFNGKTHSQEDVCVQYQRNF